MELNSRNELHNEKDVEVVLLEPMLEKLGYKREHWRRQMVLKIGRSQREIPDYVVFPVYTPGKERGKIVLEAKYSIPNKNQQEEDRRQGASYARQLLSDYMVLVSKEGIWLYQRASNYEEWIFEASWSELEKDKDIFNNLYGLIGYKK